MGRIPMTNTGYTVMREGMQVLRIYDVDYNEQFGKLTVFLCNAQAETTRTVFQFKAANGAVNSGAANAFSYFAKTAMDDFEMLDVDPVDLIGHYIKCDVEHSEYNGKTYANIGREKEVAYEFEESPDPRALSMTRKPAAAKPEAPVAKQPISASSSYFDLDDILG